NKAVEGIEAWELTVDNNNATQEGGGIYNAGRQFFVRTTISTNTAGGNGGGVFFTKADNSYCELYFTTVAFNTAAAGGGVYVNSPNTLGVNTVTSATIVAKNKRPNGTADD